MRLFIDGCFDVFHFGHANALRQAHSTGTHIIVGINTSTTIEQHKSPPVMTDRERKIVVDSCKYAHETVYSPYMLDFSQVRDLKIDIVMHGDDHIISGNVDCYGEAKRNGCFMTFERTKGVSTSEIVGRILYREWRSVAKDIEEYLHVLIGLFKDDIVINDYMKIFECKKENKKNEFNDKNSTNTDDLNNCSINLKFDENNSEKMCNMKYDIKDNTDEFEDNNTNINIDLHNNKVNSTISYKNTLANDKVIAKRDIDNSQIKIKQKRIYLDGTFDLYHAGHTSIIEYAKKRGSYLIVGLHNDDEICKIKGQRPILNNTERKLCLLSNKHIDEILENIPYKLLDKDFFEKYDIDEIVCGTESVKLYEEFTVPVVGFKNEFAYLNSDVIVDRIVNNYWVYKKKIQK